MTNDEILARVQGYVLLFRATGGHRYREQLKLTDAEVEALTRAAMLEVGQTIAQLALALEVMESEGCLPEFEKKRESLSRASQHRGVAITTLEDRMKGAEDAAVV